MKVAIEARALTARSGGIKSYAQNMVHELGQHAGIELDIIDGSRNSALPLRAELLVPYWLNGPVAKHIADTKPDIVHFTKAATPSKKYAPTVVTIYDVIPLLLPETQSFLRRQYWPRALRQAVMSSDRIITISEKSKEDISKFLHVDAEKITVTKLAVDAKHFSPSAKPAYRSGRATGDVAPYILFVGTWDERKNIATLIKAFELIADTIPHRLVIAGKPAHKHDSSQAYASTSKFSDKIQFIKNVPYAELPALYSNADVFVWPSLYEGWGFPPQEAMACGTPVIVSDGGSLPEVVGDAGIIAPFSTHVLHDRLHDEEFTKNLSEKMMHVLTNENLKKDMIARGLVQARKNSWHDVMEKTVGVYKELLV